MSIALEMAEEFGSSIGMYGSWSYLNGNPVKHALKCQFYNMYLFAIAQSEIGMIQSFCSVPVSAIVEWPKRAI